jgi:putative ABC transport system substrate-binding protein
MKRRQNLAALSAYAAALAVPWAAARAQAPAGSKPRRVGVLQPGTDPEPGVPAAQRSSAAAWKSLGWVDGETLRVERRYAAWRIERMPELVNDLLRHDPEVLIAFGPDAAVAAARATRTIPIVFTFALLPIKAGLVDSYARPGRNATGTALTGGVEIGTKLMEFLRAAAPSARRLAFLSGDVGGFTVSGAPIDVSSDYATAAETQGFDYQVHRLRRIEDVDRALAEAAAGHAQAMATSGLISIAARERIAEFALRQRWPSATLNPELLDAGLLIYYGPTPAEWVRMSVRSIEMADRILRGAKPADLPVELPARYELALNLMTARALGLTLSPSLLVRAERVIE